MRVALAQINSVLGDFAGNAQRILQFAERARERRCDLVVFPEAALFGYHPVDLLERPSIVEAQTRHLRELARRIPRGIGLLFGAIVPNPAALGKPYWNAAVFLTRGAGPKYFPKQLLPTYDVFDEGRHIQPGEVQKNILHFKGHKILVTICEDIWAWPLKDFPKFARYARNPLLNVPRSSVDFVVNLSASPFTQSKMENRLKVTRQTVKRFRCPLVYVNMVGAQDELIFDGGSFALDSKGEIRAQCLRFREDLNVYDLDLNEGGLREQADQSVEILREALVMGLGDFVRKTGFEKVHLGLSGGIDSALVACIAVDALGPDRVSALALPGPYSSPKSLLWAKQLAKNLGIQFRQISINALYKKSLSEIQGGLGKMVFSVVHENLQARLRGMILMAQANRDQSLLLATSNKCELATGYSTLYGDMCGGLLPIGDLLKSDIYALSKLYNQQWEVIPKAIIRRPPSAELRPGQRDQDSLPSYSRLDPAVEKLVEGYRPAKGAMEKKILSLMMRSEFKRWQSAPILKVSDHAFGRGRRLPLAHKARD